MNDKIVGMTLAQIEAENDMRQLRERRERIATAVVCGFAANPSLVETWSDPATNRVITSRHFTAKEAVKVADYLIAELDKVKP